MSSSTSSSSLHTDPRPDDGVHTDGPPSVDPGPSDAGDNGRPIGSDEAERVEPDSPTGWFSVGRFLPVLVVFAVLFGLYQVLLQTVLSPAVYSENPSQSSLINIQDALYGEPEEVAIVGSSISARFLSEFFAEQGVPVAGLALDAQGPALGIDLLADAERLPGTVAVELNRSLYSSSGNEQTIFDTVASPGFDLARGCLLYTSDAADD